VVSTWGRAQWRAQAYASAKIPVPGTKLILQVPAVLRWDEYAYLKPMTLDAAAGGVAVVPMAHLYDRLRSLPHWEKRAKVPSRTTVHVTVGSSRFPQR